MILSQKHLSIEGNAVISRYAFEPPLNAVSNLKDEACFIVPIDSKGSLYRTDGRTDVETGQGVLMKCGTYVNKWYGTDDRSAAQVIILRLNPELLAGVLKDARDLVVQKDNRTGSSIVVGLDDLLQNYVDSLLFYFENPGLVNDELVRVKIKELILLLIRIKDPHPIRELLENLFYSEQISMAQIVQNNIFESLSLEEYAGLAGMSISNFKRKFKAQFGVSAGRYIREKRLEKAKELLTNQQMNIAEIAYYCGFNDPGYFARCFKNYVGSTPSTYKK